MKLKDISIILMTFGIAVILASFLDFYSLLFPVLIKNPEWVFVSSQKTADLIIFPVLGLLFFWVGLNFSNFKRSQKIIKISKVISGSLCILFFCSLSFNTIMYGISMNSVKSNKIEELKIENNSYKEKINIAYNQNRKNISKKNYNLAVKQLNDNLLYKINYLDLTYTKMNIKTLMTLLLFSFVYLIATIKIFSLDVLLKKKKFIKNEYLKKIQN
jgi:hypothetical protein